MEACISARQESGVVIDELLTDELAARVLGWQLAPGRYIKPGRSWIPRWRFQPLTNIGDAFQLLDAAAISYRLEAEEGTLTAEIRTDSRNGRASGQCKARTITMALVHALGIEVPHDAATPDSTRSHSKEKPSRSKIDGV
jgi:hypothetical protein